MGRRSVSHSVSCPYCGSRNVIKYGKRKGRQRYLCKMCGKQFTEHSLKDFTWHKKPDHIVVKALVLILKSFNSWSF